MAQAVRHQTYRMSVAEFLATDFGGDTQWELIDGEPVAQASPSPAHSTIQAELAFHLRGNLQQRGLAGSCRVMTEVGIPTALDTDHNWRQPDVAVTSEPFNRDDPFTRHPILVIEILSPHGEKQQRAKLQIYAALASVQEILLIDSLTIRAELHRRDVQGAWPQQPEIIEGSAMLTLDCMELTMPLSDLYVGLGME